LVAASIGRHRALAMALLAERLPAADALQAGLVTAVYPAADFHAEADKVVARLLAGPAVAYAKTKAAVNAATLTELDGTFGREREGQSQLLLSPDLREGILAFHERRPPTFTDR
jgi:enoyl-CoA hydratase